MPYKTILLLCGLSFLSACGGGVTSSSPSDDAVKEILLDHWNGADRILTGQVSVTTGGNEWSKHEISEPEFKQVQAWEKAGLITLAVEEVLSNKKRFNWNDWLTRTQGGVTKKIRVMPTALGLQVQKDSDLKEPLDQRFLYARVVTIKIDELIENKEIKKDVTLYRTAKGFFVNNWSEIGKKIHSSLGLPMPGREKFIVLLKYDSFTRKSGQVIGDEAPADKEFTTNNVESYLARH